MFKSLFYSIGCSNLNYIQNFICFADLRFSFQLNDTLVGLELKTIYFFFGTNIRLEVPLLNARIRKVFLNKYDFQAYSVGFGLNHLTFPVKNIGIQRTLYFYFF